MKTEVVMKRGALGEIISQKSKSGFFSVTELERAGNKYRIMNDLPLVKLNSYFSNGANKEFIKELDLDLKLCTEFLREVLKIGNNWAFTTIISIS